MLTAAVVGLGWWGQTILRMLAPSPALRIGRLVSASAAGAALGRAHGIPTTPDYADALADPAIEAVILATPNSLHPAQVIAAAAAGKHVFCEKPLALATADAEAAVAACGRAGVVLGIGHERRFEPALMELARLLRAGALGAPLLIEANFSQDRFLDLKPGNWRLSTAEAPAGPLTATGVHLLDLAVSLLGPAESVLARVHDRGAAFANGDAFSALVGFPGGAQALVGALLITPFASRFALYGNEGWAEVVDLAHPDRPAGARLALHRRGTAPVQRDFPAVSAVRANLEAFAAAAREEAPYPIPTAEMIATVALTEAAIRSAAAGAVVTLSPRKPEGTAP